MTQQRPISENRSPSFFDAEVVSHWLSLHIQNILYGLAVAILLLVTVYFFAYRSTKLSEQEYQKAANDFAIFTRSSSTETPQQAESLQSLQSLMAQHTDLQAAYGGAIAQTLINRGKIADALPLAEQALERTKEDNLPFYQAYSRTTLLILQEKYAEALKDAQALQTEMEGEIKAISAWEKRSFSPELFPLNLFRIAMLQQQVGDRAGEKATWKLWNQYAGMTPAEGDSLAVDARPFRLIIQQLAIGSTSLPDYIKERLKDTPQEKK